MPLACPVHVPFSNAYHEADHAQSVTHWDARENHFLRGLVGHPLHDLHGSMRLLAEGFPRSTEMEGQVGEGRGATSAVWTLRLHGPMDPTLCGCAVRAALTIQLLFFPEADEAAQSSAQESSSSADKLDG